MTLHRFLAVAGAFVAAAALAAPAAAAEQHALDASGLMSTLDAKAAAGVPDSVTGWYVDGDQVVVSVLRADADGTAWARSFGGPVRVESVTAKPRRMWDIIGGQALFFEAGRCSVGFSAYDSSGVWYVITAGHCTAMFDQNVIGVGAGVGRVVGSSYPDNDYGIIRVSTPGAVTTPLVDLYDSGEDVAVQGVSRADRSDFVCRSGSTTGWQCGRVAFGIHTVNYGNGDIVSGLTKTSACAEPGDSGGPFLSMEPVSRNRALGILSGGSGDCASGGTTYYQPIREVLDAYGVTLYSV